jgi:hypothetical protein
MAASAMIPAAAQTSALIGSSLVKLISKPVSGDRIGEGYRRFLDQSLSSMGFIPFAHTLIDAFLSPLSTATGQEKNAQRL